MLDSFGLEGENNECGGLYSIKEPRLNMCFPPLSWQTYDFDFTAPKFDAAGKKVANARVTLLHNGVAIYQDFELPKLTPGGRDKEGATGPLQLQNHGNPVNLPEHLGRRAEIMIAMDMNNRRKPLVADRQTRIAQIRQRNRGGNL